MELLNPLTVPRGDARYLRKVFSAVCQATDAVGDCVYGSGPYQVSRADPYDWGKMPAIGVIESKSGTDCLVHTFGEVPGLYTGITPGKILFVGQDGRLSHTAPAGSSFVQTMGAAVSGEVVLLIPSLSFNQTVSGSDDVKRLLINSRGHVLHDTIGELVLKVGP